MLPTARLTSRELAVLSRIWSTWLTYEEICARMVWICEYEAVTGTPRPTLIVWSFRQSPSGSLNSKFKNLLSRMLVYTFLSHWTDCWWCGSFALPEFSQSNLPATTCHNKNPQYRSTCLISIPHLDMKIRIRHYLWADHSIMRCIVLVVLVLGFIDSIFGRSLNLLESDVRIMDGNASLARQELLADHLQQSLLGGFYRRSSRCSWNLMHAC